MSLQDAIREFSSACERFRWALQHEWMFESRLTEDSHPADVQRLLDMIRERCGISNELVALSQAAVATLTAHNLDEAALSVSRVAVASQVLQGYVNRWPEMWFECKSHLAKAAIVAGREPPAEKTEYKWHDDYFTVADLARMRRAVKLSAGSSTMTREIAAEIEKDRIQRDGNKPMRIRMDLFAEWNTKKQ